jgi:hypothetical protein
MFELSGVNLTPQIGHKIETFCSRNINKELTIIDIILINNKL